ncbi:MAG: hypothetical protein QXO25_02805 [Candidatus Bathyarchaeia archaeon]
MKRTITYFETPGFANTALVIEAVKERLTLGDVGTVLVPATTGRTAQQFQHALGNAEVIAISEDEVLEVCERRPVSDRSMLDRMIRRNLPVDSERDKEARRQIFDMTLLPICGEAWNVVRDVLYAFGQGMKVAVEVCVAAVAVGRARPYIRVVAVGGTGEGADTAVVARTSTQKEAFGHRPEKRLVIQEVVAMPMTKWL